MPFVCAIPFFCKNALIFTRCVIYLGSRFEKVSKDEKLTFFQTFNYEVAPPNLNDSSRNCTGKVFKANDTRRELSEIDMLKIKLRIVIWCTLVHKFFAEATNGSHMRYWGTDSAEGESEDGLKLTAAKESEPSMTVRRSSDAELRSGAVDVPCWASRTQTNTAALDVRWLAWSGRGPVP